MKTDEIDARAINQVLIAHPEGEEPIHVRVGRYGPFIEQGDLRASLPDGMAPEELTLERCRELFSQAAQADEPLGVCPETNKPVYMKVGRFGPYVQRGTPEDEDKPQNASLLKGMKPEEVDLAMALKLLSLPRTLGNYPENGEAVVVFNGRFGPYVKCGEETRSLPAGVSPLEVTLAEAIELLKQPKAQRRGFGAKREPLKVFDASPVTSNKVQLLDGRYGMYVTDGETNASIPKGTSAEEVTFDLAISLLKERAEAGPSKKKASRRSSTARKKPSGSRKRSVAAASESAD
jgi:DNA topoisomerase-1